MQTWLTEHAQIDVPVISAPMGGVAGGALARAVSAAGALGMVGAGPGTDPDWIARELDVVASAGRPFGVGLLGWAVTDVDAVLAVLAPARPVLVSVSYGGELSDWVAGLHDAGITVATQVGTLDDARDADAIGVDLLVVRGAEAGGHGRNQVATLPLLQAVLDDVDTPVVAAGGIGTARGVAAVVAAGAAGAWVGTAFATCREAATAAPAREALLAAGLEDTVYTRVFDLAQGAGWPAEFGGRALTNAVTRTWAGREQELEARPPALTALADQVAKARADGDVAFAPVWAGQAVGLVERPRTAAELVAELARADALLRRAAGL
ncbi:NAD(P)H-dependent flavin oxidoreductase [Nakamurella endophytica]|uniref:2-nitropropane dioxygenase n=1 Tax=Nakamurella endophytica TaxID=1748367 RepID=A0A917WP07_9ACTN|nr:nitronate monooxygenase [Nakamurella endophytica]GGM18248.1 2-nitropropane dioxygenase [Nakamurella endophytica]